MKECALPLMQNINFTVHFHDKKEGQTLNKLIVTSTGSSEELLGIPAYFAKHLVDTKLGGHYPCPKGLVS